VFTFPAGTVPVSMEDKSDKVLFIVEEDEVLTKRSQLALRPDIPMVS
jgi:hypothetical protein